MRKNFVNKLLIFFLLLSLVFISGCKKETFSTKIPESQVPTLTVLAYHRILDNGPSFIDVSTGMFDDQLTWLKENGYNVIDYDTFADFLNGKTTIPNKSVLITFDDGYKETLTYATPILVKHKLPAVLYIYSDRIKDYSHSGGLSVDELKDMQQKGWSIQAHTITHADLSQLNPVGVKREIVDNKELIERLLGTKVTSIAYPYGAYTEEVEALVKEAGYTNAVLIEEGPNTHSPNPYRIYRHMLYAKDTLEDFAYKVTSSPLNVKRTVPSQAQVIDYKPATVIVDVELPDGLEVVKTFADRESETLYARFDKAKQRVVVDTPNLPYGHSNITVRLLANDGRMYIYGWSFVIK